MSPITKVTFTLPDGSEIDIRFRDGKVELSSHGGRRGKLVVAPVASNVIEVFTLSPSEVDHVGY